jgi:hypothetical protein
MEKLLKFTDFNSYDRSALVFRIAILINKFSGAGNSVVSGGMDL